MKNNDMKKLMFILISSGLLFSCAQGYQEDSTANSAVNPNRPDQIAPMNNTPSPVATGVQHYICPNNCAGSGGATEGTCPTCGSAYTHNQAFHNQTQPSQNQPVANSGVQHYICPNSCAGSGGATEGTCPTCGSAYIHNQAFHNQGAPSAASPIQAAPQGTQPLSPLFQNQTSGSNNAGNTPSALSIGTVNPGVYHYVCTNGCAGGSGAAGNCATCGVALAHNAAYHNN